MGAKDSHYKLTLTIMGLDQYAYRRFHTKQWKSQDDDERYTVKVTRGGKPVVGCQSERISGVEVEVMYWRKANQLHGWLVKHVQNGKDDCKPYHVDFETLSYLLEDCKKVIESSKLVDGMIKNGETYNSKTNTWESQRAPGKVIEDSTVAQATLPATEGFFFGHYEYNESYLDDVIATHNWLERMINDHNKGLPGDIYYHSSW